MQMKAARACVRLSLFMHVEEFSMFLQSANQPDAALVEKISCQGNISPRLAAALVRRGITQIEDIKAFLYPLISNLYDPMLLLDMPEAIARIQKAIELHEPICIYGDYDVDGICATVILLSWLKEAGALVEYYIPNRHTQGYGLNVEAVKIIAGRGIKLLITVDNGISAVEEVRLCRELGMDVIVTDHHECPPCIPECTAIINPKRGGDTYPFNDLCGAGVALKVVQALGGITAVEKILPIAALATLADVVPLKGENRTILALGMKKMHAWPGVEALLEVSGSTKQQVTDEVLAYMVAPRLNAAGRMGDAGRGVRLLLASNLEEARPLAVELNDENQRRKEEEARILREIDSKLKEYDFLNHRSIVLAGKEWNPGVIGIIASRLTERFHLPVILFSDIDGCLHGSGRSIPGVHLYEVLESVSEHFEKFGGHAQAAGITMQKSEFETFCAALEIKLRDIPAQVFLPKQYYEEEILFADATLELANELKLLAPHGEGNPQPVFKSAGVHMQQIQYMGKEGQHVRARAAQQSANQRQLIAFGQAREAKNWNVGEWDILYTLKDNEYRNNHELQLMLKGIELERTSLLRFSEYDIRKFYDAFFCNIIYNSSEKASWVCSICDQERYIERELKKDFQGTLILCVTPHGAMRLLQFLESVGLMHQVQIAYGSAQWDGPHYNSIVFAPHLEKLEAGYWKNIFIYDAGIWEGISTLLHGKSDQIFCSQDNNVSMSAFFSIIEPNRNKMADAFRVLAKICAGNSEMKRQAVLSKAHAYIGYDVAAIALKVFVELGFFNWDSKNDSIARVLNCETRDLEESSTFLLMKNLNQK